MKNLVPWKKQDNGNVKDWREQESYPLAQFRKEFDSIWNSFWGDWNRNMSQWDEDSRLGFNEGFEDEENEYVFHADLPGFDADEIEVKLSANSLMLKAEHKEESKDKQSSSYRYGSYQRYFQLPQSVDVETIDAKYQNGVLEIHLPKSESGKAKRIPVSAK